MKMEKAGDFIFAKVKGYPAWPARVPEDAANDTMDDSVADTTAAEDTVADESAVNTTQAEPMVEDSDDAGALVIDEGKKGRKSNEKPAPVTPKTIKELKTPRGKKKVEAEESKEEEKKDEEIVSRSGRKIRPKRYIDEQTEENTTPSPAPKKRRGGSPTGEKDEKTDKIETKNKSEKIEKVLNTVTQAELEDLKKPFNSELDIKPLMLLKHPSCGETIKRERAYVGNAPSWELSERGRIRRRADSVSRRVKLEPGVQKELDERKRLEQLSRSLLPDAPPRKRQNKQQNDAAKALKQESEEHVLARQDSCATPNSNISTAESSVVGELLVDFTSGLLKSDKGNWFCLPISTPQELSGSDINSSAVEVDMAPPENVKKINLDSYSEKTEADLQKWLDSPDSDEDEDMVDVANVQTDEPTNIPHQMTTAYDFELISTDLHDWLIIDDIKSDRVVTKLIPTDHLSFDWVHDHNTFRGKREPFTGVVGPTFPVTGNMTPLDIFFKFFDKDLFDLIIRQTNKNATRKMKKHLTPHSRLKYFKNVDRDEIAKFLAILILQGSFPNPVEKSYWGENGYLTLKYFADIMTYNRFVLIKRLLHFSDPTDNQTLTNDEKKLRKIQPVIDHLQKKFSSLYLPRQEIAIDESLLKWQGHLSFAQKIATKAAKVGIKSYELCESDTGYLWRFFIYTGKTDGHTDDLIDRQTDLTEGRTDGQRDLTEGPRDMPPLPTNATSKIVHDLLKPLYNLGHTLVMDNFYNSPLLARYLKSKKTDCFGTLRLNREFVPEAMKKIQKHELREGEIVHSYTEDLSVVLWRDSNLVSLISTYHDGVVGGAEKYGRFKYKPTVVLDYNRTMGGVDRKDQLLSAFPIERVRNIVWYKKVFRRLLNVTLMNAHIIFSTRQKCSARDFRRQVAEGLVKVFQPAEIVQSVHTTKTIEVPKTKKTRPILNGNHFICQGPCKMARCVWCKNSRTRYICEQCQVSLCLEICFKEYHTVP